MKNILLFLSILLFAFECHPDVRSDKKRSANIEDLNIKKLPSQLIEPSFTPIDTFIEQEIKYFAPLSAAVNLAWRIENYPLDQTISWNSDTKLTNGLLYLPMVAFGDTFKVKLKVPIGSTIQYYFWITRNKHGYYQDFWDLQSSGKIKVNNVNPITKKAIYSKTEKKHGSRILSMGWLLLLLLIGMLLLLKWIQKKWNIGIQNTSIIEKVLFLGLSLSVFHALARAEIIGVSPLNIIHNSRILVEIIRGSFSDFLFIAGLVLVFILSLSWINNVKICNLVYGIFIFLALFSTLVAYANITTVIFLGKPFTYQWLYYSGFLGSNEAKTAIQENLSVSIVFNLIAICLSMLILSSVLQTTYQLARKQFYLKSITYSLFIGVLLVLFFQSFKIKETWTKGQSENAITSISLPM